jgi:hypothetical protein
MVPGSVIRAGSRNVVWRQEVMNRREIGAHRVRRGVRCEQIGWGWEVMSMAASVMSR